MIDNFLSEEFHRKKKEILMSITLTSPDICFCFNGEVIFKLPFFVFKKNIPMNLRNKSIYCDAYTIPDRFTNEQKKELVINLLNDVHWDYIDKFIPISPDSRYYIKEMWKNKTNQLNKYSIETKYTDIPEKIFCYMEDNYERLYSLFKNEMYLSSPHDFRDPFDCNLNQKIFKTIKNVGIRCFSSENNNILLYSHYANKHKGICICFESEKLKESMHSNRGDATIRPVYYFNIKPSFDYKKEPVLYLTAKYDVWSYEKEYRLFLVNNKRLLHKGTYPYDSQSIQSIYFGYSASNVFIDYVKDITNLPHDRYYKAIRQPKRFGVGFHQI